MTGFTGIWVPLVTPFHNGEIDFPALQAMARRLIDAGHARSRRFTSLHSVELLVGAYRQALL